MSQKDIELIFSKSPEVPLMLRGDAGRLNQVLTNLIENAIKFTATGEVFVGVGLDDTSGTSSGQVVLKFRVSDTGMGIATDVLSTLFDPFVQVDSSLTREHEGAGLGLAICRRLVELMDGRIWAESTPGEGSTFYFTVLLETEKKDKPQLSIPADLHGLKALVVEESDTAGQFLEDLLKSFTFNVSTVHSGEKAVEEFHKAGVESPFQLVLLNWKLSGMDGLETARRIRGLEHQELETKNQSKIPFPQTGKQKTPIIILVTAYGLERMQERNDTATVDHYLLKPVKPSHLFNTIMEMFGKAEAVLANIKTERAEYHPPQAGHRVLVVEDSALNREVVVALLAEAGPEVETAEDGRAAVKKVTDAPIGYFDAVLMDIQMPVMDGYEATRRIRAWEFKVQHESSDVSTNRPPTTDHRIPIIALTAHALKGEKEKCLAAGMDDYIAKPVDEHHLRRVLLKWISHQKEREDKVKRVQVSGPSQDLAVLDVQGALKRLGGREYLYLKVVQKFIPEFGNAPEAITDRLAAGDIESAKNTAHSLKGAAASIGAMALSQAAAIAEKAIAGREADWQEAIVSAKNELEKAHAEISAYLKKKSSSTQSIAAPMGK
jgi:CheY-like chemotaxis protein